ncbi:MAG: phosphatidate cytidylyltransferase [Terriglobia bacterium]
MIPRIATAVLLIPLVIALVLWAPAWLFLLGLLPVVLLALWEYLELAARTGATPGRAPLYLVALAVLVVATFAPGHLFGSVVAGTLVLFAAALFRREKTAEVLWGSASSAFGLLWVALPFALAALVRSEQGRWALLFLLILVWVSDTAAYFGGRAFGRHKLAASISPGKTVEGTLASALAALAVGYWLFTRWFPDSPAVHAFALPLVVNLAAQVGDLAESGVKRSAGVKDSSGLLPGHGGVLDRIDALLFALPALWYYWKLLL